MWVSDRHLTKGLLRGAVGERVQQRNRSIKTRLYSWCTGGREVYSTKLFRSRMLVRLGNQ